MSAVAISRDGLPANIKIRHNLKPGDIGHLTYLHGVLYAKEYGWDHTLEAYVAPPLAKFATSQTGRERIWIVEKDAEIAGSIAIVEGSEAEAQLRWLLLRPDVRGHGIGRLLVEEAIAFCRDCGYSSRHEISSATTREASTWIRLREFWRAFSTSLSGSDRCQWVSKS